MGFQKLYEELLTLRPQIDEKLKDVSFEKIKELELWLAKSESYRLCMGKDTQLKMLKIFCDIWIEEKRKLPQLGIDEDIFYGVDSLAMLEKKYLTIQFGLLRLETPMPEEYYEQVIDSIIKYRVSGIALHRIIVMETRQRRENIVNLSQRMKNRGEIMRAVFLLQLGAEDFLGDREILCQLADCWLAGGQIHQACQCLEKINRPNKEIKKLIWELREVQENEKAE